MVVVDEVKVLLKDTLRAARFSLRSGTPLGAPVPRPFTHLADGVLTHAEDAIRVIAGRRAAPDAVDRSLAICREAATRRTPGHDDRILRPAVYTVVKALLASRGVTNAFIAERALVVALRSAQTGTFQPDAFAAGLVLRFRKASPIRLIDCGSDGVDLDRLNTQTAVALGLAIATVARTDTAPAQSVIDSADMVAGAAYDRFQAALSAKDPIRALEAEIGEIAPYLP